MSVFSRFAQKFAEVAAKSRQFSTTVKRKGMWGLDFSKVHEPWQHTMNVQASQWNKWKFIDITWFWFTCWATPFLAIAAYNAVFIGPATLEPIPEGYEPKEWEYESKPITRWFCKNVWQSEQEIHEIMMAKYTYSRNQLHQRQLFAEVRRLINEDGDYAAYGYLPFSAKQTRIVNKMREDHYREGGTYN